MDNELQPGDRNRESGCAARRIGPYRVVREIGRGGMAVVLLAERADGEFEQQVALKLIKPGLDSEQILQRFSRERQILASLHHPAIAGLVDGGVTDEGRPYLAMEYVEGVPIDVYCDQHRLSVEERLKLLDMVAEAVEHAHRSLVIHKDLKPDNILVAEGGHVKLLDFGIASVLDQGPGASETQPGLEGSRVMTPELASPEQLRGAPLTTAADVYQLGVLLYLMMTGKHPCGLSSGTSEEMARAARDQDPRPPSAAAGPAWRSTPEETPDITATPTAASSRLKGDLDAIILMAIRREPEHRYASVHQLRQDIARHLEGKPVEARSRKVGYVAGRFLRRHTAAAASVAAIIVMVAGLTGAYTAQLAHERDRVQSEAERASEVADFLQHLFDDPEADQIDAEQLSARELLDRGAERIRSDLDGQPETRAEILSVLGRISHKLGSYERAEELLTEALRIRERCLGKEHVDVASTLRDLGILYYDQGKHDQAEPLYQRALAIREQAYGPTHADVAACINSLAILRYDQGRYDEAETLYRRALEIWEEVYGPDHHEVATALQNLAILYRRQGDYEAAEPMYRRSLEIKERSLGPEHPGVASCINSLAILCYDQGRYEEAETYYRRALELREKAFGESHPEVAVSLNNLALLLIHCGDLSSARPLLERAIAIWEHSLGPDHPFIASGLNNLAEIQIKTGHLDVAEPLVRRALAIREQAYGADHPAVAESLSYLADLAAAEGDVDRADPLYRQVASCWEASLGPEHSAVVSVLTDHASLLIRAHRRDEANGLLNRCLEICNHWGPAEELSASERVVVASVHLASGKLHQQAGEDELAQTCWTEAAELAMPVAGRAADMGGLEIEAEALLRLGRADEARPIVKRLQAMGWRDDELQRLCRQSGVAG